MSDGKGRQARVERKTKETDGYEAVYRRLVEAARRPERQLA